MNKNEKTLCIIVGRTSWDMLRKGERTEIYLDPRFYWYTKLLGVDREGYGYFGPSCEGDFEDLFRESHDSFKEFTQNLKVAIRDGIFAYKDFDHVKISLSRHNDAPYLLFRLDTMTIDTGRPEWGAVPNKEYFVLMLGKRIKKPEECQHYYIDGCYEDVLCSNTMRGCYGVCQNFKDKPITK